MTIIIREEERTLPHALSEVRKAMDFCCYYALQAEKCLSNIVLSGYTDESDVLRMNGRGIILCISPWNFSIAIFTGQIVAAFSNR